jgi:hypothetical protein
MSCWAARTKYRATFQFRILSEMILYGHLACLPIRLAKIAKTAHDGLFITFVYGRYLPDAAQSRLPSFP